MKARTFLFGKVFVYYSINIYVMSVLNFMQWLKNPRLTNKVKGDSIVMTGTVNGENYDAQGITIAELSANLQGVIIPKLNMHADKRGMLSVSYLPTAGNDLWQSFNPNVYLFRYSKKKRKRINVNTGGKQGKEIVKTIKAGFKHIPHLMGAKHQGAFYSGETIEVFHTEFELLVNQPYMSQPLYEFDANEFYRNMDRDERLSNNTPAIELGSILPSNRVNVYGAKSVYLKFAIGIENPDKDSKFPIIFGELSDVVQLIPIVDHNDYIKIRFNFVPTGIKRNIQTINKEAQEA
tara:strand:+ start:22 stop:897 length:876 start_codon:yes stop_codon:yes gene_type:complete